MFTDFTSFTRNSRKTIRGILSSFPLGTIDSLTLYSFVSSRSGSTNIAFPSRQSRIAFWSIIAILTLA